MNYCAACSMPLENNSLVGLVQGDQSFCIHCVDSDHRLKSCEEIFAGGVEFFLTLDPTFERKFVEKIVRKNMLHLPYWQNNPAACLQGDIASDEEFSAVLSRLQK